MDVAAWTPWQAWWLDVLKSVLTFGIGAFITVLVLHRLDDRRDDAKFLAQAGFQLRMSALDDFRRATLAYLRAGVEAFTDLYQWNGGPEKTDAMQHFEQDVYRAYQVALEGVESRFHGTRLEQSIESLRRAGDARYAVYDRLVDRRLDGYPWPADEPDASRPAFDKLSDEMQALRAASIAELETEIRASGLRGAPTSTAGAA